MGVIRQVLQESGAVGLGAAVHEQRVTVGRRLGDKGGGCRASRAGMVLDCHWLIPQLRKFLANRAGYHVHPTTSPEGLDDTDRSSGIVSRALEHQSHRAEKTKRCSHLHTSPLGEFFIDLKRDELYLRFTFHALRRWRLRWSVARDSTNRKIPWPDDGQTGCYSGREVRLTGNLGPGHKA